MKNKKELFRGEDIALVCPKKMVWDEMEVRGDKRRLCDGCDKVLFDVTGYSKEEVHELQKEHGNICVAVTNVLIASTLSLSSLAAGGDILGVEKERFSMESSIEVIGIVDVEPIPVLYQIPMVGMPPRVPLPPLPECDEGTKNLNAIKKFFGFEGDRSCDDGDSDE